MGALAALALLAAGCGEGPARTFGTVTDCADVGRVDRATDREDDQGEGAGSATDLVEVGVARGPGELCVSWRVAGRIGGPSAYSIQLAPQSGDALAQLDVLVLGGQAPEVRLRSADAVTGDDVPGAVVGGKGDLLTVAVPAGAVTAAGVTGTPRWRARAVAARDEGRRPTDCLPDPCGPVA